MKWSNSCGDQATHFVSCIESLNVDNPYCNHKNAGTTFDVGLLYVSFTKEGKTQVGWVIVVGRKV